MRNETLQIRDESQGQVAGEKVKTRIKFVKEEENDDA